MSSTLGSPLPGAEAAIDDLSRKALQTKPNRFQRVTRARKQAEPRSTAQSNHGIDIARLRPRVWPAQTDTRRAR